MADKYWFNTYNSLGTKFLPEQHVWLICFFSPSAEDQTSWVLSELFIWVPIKRLAWWVQEESKPWSEDLLPHLGF